MSTQRKKQRTESVIRKGDTMSSESSLSWSKLPDLAVVNILRFSDSKDRRNLAQTCKTWERLSHSPVLWRTAILDFARNGVSQSHFSRVMRHAKYIRHLQIFGSNSYQTLEPLKRSNVPLECLPALFGGLVHSDLSSLRMVGVNVAKNFRYSHTFVSGLAAVLSRQQHLKTARFTSLRVEFSDGLTILSALASLSGKSVSQLDINHYFAGCTQVYGREFSNVIGKFSNLKLVYLNYHCLSDSTVAALVQNNAKTLRFLSVDVYEDEPHSHTVSTASWRQLKASCPSLEVEFEIEYVDVYHEFRTILSPGIPLHTLNIWTGCEVEDELRMPALILYITENFSDNLEEISFQLDNNDTSVDQELIHLVKSCKKLSALEIFATIGLDCLHEICRLRENAEIGLNKFHVTLCSATEEEEVDLIVLAEHYTNLFHRQEIDYEFSADSDMFSDTSDSEEVIDTVVEQRA